MELTQRYRRFVTVPVWIAALVFQLAAGYLYLIHRLSDVAIWRAGKTTACICVIVLLVEWTMGDGGNGQNKRGFDVLPK